MILSLLIAGFVVVSFLVTYALAREVMRLENQSFTLKQTLDSLSDDVTTLDDELLSVQKQLREAKIKLASHDELIVLAHSKFDRLNAERELKDATISP